MAAAGSAKAQAALKKQTEQQAAEYARVVCNLHPALLRGAQLCFVLILPGNPGRRTGAVRQLAAEGTARLCHPSRLGIVLIPSVYNAQAKATIKELQEENKVLLSKCEDFTLVFGDVPKKSN